MDRRTLLGAAIGTGALAVLPTTSAEAAPRRRPVYSNLTEPAIRRQARTLLLGAGIARRRVDVFDRHVDQFVHTIPPSMLTRGLEPLLPYRPKYDPYVLQDIWAKKHPSFPGYNCRITAFGLFCDRFRLQHLNTLHSTALFMDKEALDADPSALVRPSERYRFEQLYTPVPTVASTDPRRHLDVLQRAWRRRGIGFVESPKARLISVVVHNKIDADELFVGHTGILLPTRDALWFVEKLAFQAPYQLVRFSTRRELNDYLMPLYDLDGTGTMAPPVILENDRLMAGYRVRR